MIPTHKQKRCGRRLLKLFVYGTLKKGCPNHDVYCNTAFSAEQAAVRGRLYEHPFGFPILRVPQREILAVGTIDPLADAITQASHEKEFAASWHERVMAASQQAEWPLIRGELLTFDDPESCLPVIDELEDYYPEQVSVYSRVLLPVLTGMNSLVPAWAYVSGISTRGLKLIDRDHWSC